MEGEISVFIITAKVPRRKVALGAAAAALLCCCLISLRLGDSAPCSAAAAPKSLRTNQDRINVLSSYGWIVEEDPVSSQELVIPEEMDESYDEYLALQHEQGFDLTKYSGKRVKRYTYQVTNYPTGEQDVQANLLVYRHRLVGGEVLSPRLDGFLHGLAMP